MSRLAIEATNIRTANDAIHAVLSVRDSGFKRHNIDDKR